MPDVVVFPPPYFPASMSRSSSNDPAAPRALRIALQGAVRVLKRRFRVLLLVRDAYTRLADHAQPMQSARADLAAFLRLLKAWALRQYQRVPWTPLLLVTGAVVYFVLPVDVVPDVLMGIGFIDDVAVISATVRAVRDELDRFRMWEARRETPSVPAPDTTAAIRKPAA